MDSSDNRTGTALTRLLDVLGALRERCPWDRVQTPGTIRNYLLEEALETLEAVGKDDPERVAEELGDLLFMLLFMVRLFEEKGSFTLEEVMEASARKMIGRHPHVFGETEAKDASEVKDNWERIKMAEKDHRTSVLDGVSKTLPGLMRANRVISRLKRAHLLERVRDERPLAERVKQMEEQGSEDASGPRVLGEILLDMAVLASELGVNPESALLDSLAELEERARALEKDSS